MITRKQYEELFKVVLTSYTNDIREFSKIDFKSKSVDVAMKIFKHVKFNESHKGSKIDRKQELELAKRDLQEIFGEDTKKMTKNQIYMMHQSKMVNTIYYYFVLGEKNYV